ncbi:MAG: hypothetical protein FJW34_03465 [Acidobacteria bacterium]|nr:hypothetical protein [Acidobacteriota bacterium]
MDRLLDEARTGPRYLDRAEIAQLVVDAIQYGESELHHYVLHAFVVMANHVHLLVTPHVPVPNLLRSLKGITAKRANQALGRTGKPFWQDESYDRLVRDESEFRRIHAYIEDHPVRTGLVAAPEDYAWSSASLRRAAQGAGPRSRGTAPPALAVAQVHKPTEAEEEGHEAH